MRDIDDQEFRMKIASPTADIQLPQSGQSKENLATGALRRINKESLSRDISTFTSACEG